MVSSHHLIDMSLSQKSTKFMRIEEKKCSGLTKSLEHEDRGSIHVVEHHDDLFSWKKYRIYKCILVMARYKQ
jgi:hypothetical protein